MAGVNSHFKMSIKSTLNGFLLQMLRLSVDEITLCLYTKTIIIVIIIFKFGEYPATTQLYTALGL